MIGKFDDTFNIQVSSEEKWWANRIEEERSGEQMREKE
jgi:hypothetical protein